MDCGMRIGTDVSRRIRNPKDPSSYHGEATVAECADGFHNLAVARTRILQGSRLDVTGLSKGKHLFECCIHPWMRFEVDVK